MVPTVERWLDACAPLVLAQQPLLRGLVEDAGEGVRRLVLEALARHGAAVLDLPARMAWFAAAPSQRAWLLGQEALEAGGACTEALVESMDPALVSALVVPHRPGLPVPLLLRGLRLGVVRLEGLLPAPASLATPTLADLLYVAAVERGGAVWCALLREWVHRADGQPTFPLADLSPNALERLTYPEAAVMARWGGPPVEGVVQGLAAAAGLVPRAARAPFRRVIEMLLLPRGRRCGRTAARGPRHGSRVGRTRTPKAPGHGCAGPGGPARGGSLAPPSVGPGGASR